MSQKVLFQLFFILQLGFCAVFTRVSHRARISLTPFGKGYTEQGPCLCFHEYGALSLPLVEQNVNPRVWADGKSVGRAQNAILVVVKLKDPQVFLHKKQYPLKPEVKEGLKPIIENLKEQGLLILCNSPYNTAILDVKMSNDK